MDLDYYDESSLALPRNATITGENGVAVNLWLPPVGYVAVYRLGTGTSLGANKALVIDTAPPIVVQVTDGVYITFCMCQLFFMYMYVPEGKDERRRWH